ncbi:MAG TPA: cytochrome P450 [Ktedonobacteraceae bacterium]|nr:cytochrome P450 [Ktedonobacteraceae bacterium]
MPHTDTLPPGPKGFPFLGNTLQFQRNPLQFVRDVQRTYKDMATVHIGGATIVLLFRPEHVRYVLTENPKNFTKANRRGGPNLRAFLGDGLLTIEGDFHRQQRRLVQPAFHKKRVESYAGIMVQQAQDMLAEWQPGMELNIASAMQQLTLRIIGKTLFNIESRELIAKLGQAFTDVIENPARTLSGLRVLRNPFAGPNKSEEGKRILDDFIYKLIAERRTQGRDVGDVLSMLLAAQDEGNTMTDKQVHDQVLTFVAAGHETAQNTLSWTFYLLSKHPEVRDKLLTELHTVLAGRAPTVEDLPNLPYLEWVINESWRVFPPAWIQGRRATNAFDLDGHHFPAGTTVMFSQWVLHHEPELWGDPDNFRPERWDPARGEKERVPQWAYFPFGGGPRICIGMPFAQMETKLLLATILQHYAPRLVPGFPVVPKPRVTLRPKYGMRMILEPTPALVEATPLA